MKLLHFGARGIAFDPCQAGVDYVFDARHGERGFGHIGRQHDAPFAAARVENFVLFGVRQTGKQRQDFVVTAQRRFAQGFGGFADFAFAGQEHQNVAFAQPRQFVGGIDNRVGQLDFCFVFVLRMQRAVENIHGEGASAHFQHGRVVEMFGKALGINGGRGDDDFQIGAARQKLFQVACYRWLV